MSRLSESIRDFEEKKLACVSVAERALAEKKAFDSDFPSGIARENERLSDKGLEALLQRLSQARLKLLVAGQFNAGKSTLLNAMLGARALPEDAAPCTAVITEIEHGPKAQASLYFKSGLKEDSLPASMHKAAREHLAKHLPGDPPPFVIEDVSAEALAEYLAIPFGDERWEGFSPYSRCVLKWPLRLCRGGAVLIDSPGLNEHESRDRITMGYLEEADMILHVLSSLQPFGMPDKKFIEEARLRGKSEFPIIFAFNRFDQLGSDRDRDKIKNYAFSREELRGPYGNDGVFFTAALMGLEGRLENDAEKTEKSGVPALEAEIARILERDRFKIKLASAFELAGDLEEFNKSLDELASLLGRDSASLEKAYNENMEEFRRLENEILKIRKKAERAAVRYESEFRLKLDDFIDSFCNESAPRVVAEAELPEISLFNMKHDSEEVIRALNKLVNEALRESFVKWLCIDASALEKTVLREIQEDIQGNLKEFAAALGAVQGSLGAGSWTGAGEPDLDFRIFVKDALAGAGLGGAAGGAAVFIASRFIPIIAGPAGWALVIAATVLMAVMAAGGSDRGEKIKKEYLAAVRLKLRERLGASAPDIARAAALKFREGLISLCAGLEEKINDARKPLEITRQALRGKHRDLESQKRLLKKYQNSFNGLGAEARALCQSL